MVRVLRYVDSGELVQSDDEDDTGSQDTGRGQQWPDDDQGVSSSDDEAGGGPAAVGLGVPVLVPVGGLLAAAGSRTLSMAQKKTLFQAMQLLFRSRHPSSVQADSRVEISLVGVTPDFLSLLKAQLDGRPGTKRAPRIDTNMSSFLYYVQQMAALNTFNIYAPKKATVPKTAAAKTIAKVRTLAVTAALLVAKPAADAARAAALAASEAQLATELAEQVEFCGAASAASLQYYGRRGVDGGRDVPGLLKGSSQYPQSRIGCIKQVHIPEAAVIFQRVVNVLDDLVKTSWYSNGLTTELHDAEAALCQICYNI
ncbi:hypothetical protein B484DRAFT_460354, partial [Ochromonadaceae sp. CCMP2298]